MEWVVQQLLAFRPCRWRFENALANWDIESPKHDPKLRVHRVWNHIDLEPPWWWNSALLQLAPG